MNFDRYPIAAKISCVVDLREEADHERGSAEEHRSVAESSRTEAEEFRVLAEEARALREQDTPPYRWMWRPRNSSRP